MLLLLLLLLLQLLQLLKLLQLMLRRDAAAGEALRRRRPPNDSCGWQLMLVLAMYSKEVEEVVVVSRLGIAYMDMMSGTRGVQSDNVGKPKHVVSSSVLQSCGAKFLRRLTIAAASKNTN